MDRRTHKFLKSKEANRANESCHIEKLPGYIGRAITRVLIAVRFVAYTFVDGDQHFDSSENLWFNALALREGCMQDIAAL